MRLKIENRNSRRKEGLKIKRRKKMKRYLAMMLAAVMVLSSLPAATVWAGDKAMLEKAIINAPSSLTNLAQGDMYDATGVSTNGASYAVKLWLDYANDVVYLLVADDSGKPVDEGTVPNNNKNLPPRIGNNNGVVSVKKMFKSVSLIRINPFTTHSLNSQTLPLTLTIPYMSALITAITGTPLMERSRTFLRT
jgi:hypothetical protein